MELEVFKPNKIVQPLFNEGPIQGRVTTTHNNHPLYWDGESFLTSINRTLGVPNFGEGLRNAFSNSEVHNAWLWIG